MNLRLQVALLVGQDCHQEILCGLPVTVDPPSITQTTGYSEARPEKAARSGAPEAPALAGVQVCPSPDSSICQATAFAGCAMSEQTGGHDGHGGKCSGQLGSGSPSMMKSPLAVGRTRTLSVRCWSMSNPPSASWPTVLNERRADP